MLIKFFIYYTYAVNIFSILHTFYDHTMFIDGGSIWNCRWLGILWLEGSFCNWMLFRLLYQILLLQVKQSINCKWFFHRETAIYFRSTISHFANLEDQSRRKLLQHVTSQLKGRAVIQSFDKIEESRNRYISYSMNVFGKSFIKLYFTF